MALHAKNLSLLLLVLFFTSLQTEARESKFFTKSIHYHINKSNEPQIETPTPAPSLSLAPTPAPASILIPELPASPPGLTPELAPAPAEVEYGYGLYGQSGSREYSPETTSNENEIPNIGVEFTTESYMKTTENKIPTEVLSSKNQNGYPDNNYNGNGYTSSNNGKMNGYPDNSYNGNGYTTSNNEKNGYSDNYYGNEYTSSNNNEKNGYSDSYNGNGYVTAGRQGLSDTKFLENENYFQNGFEPVRGNGNNDEGYYGNNEDSQYEFNTMEEYERQEGYPQSQREEYTP